MLSHSMMTGMVIISFLFVFGVGIRNFEISGEFIDYLRHEISLTHEEAKTIHKPEDLEKYLMEYPG